MRDDFTSEGACSCGLVRFRVTRPPMFIHCCHCTLCQRQTGSAFVLNGLWEASAIEQLGEAPVAISMPTESGLAHDVYRCPRCQVAVWSDHRRRKVLLFVRVSVLERRAELPPDVHIFTRSKVPWLTLPPDARAFDEFYEIDREWPAESLARRKALLG